MNWIEHYVVERTVLEDCAVYFHDLLVHSNSTSYGVSAEGMLRYYEQLQKARVKDNSAEIFHFSLIRSIPQNRGVLALLPTSALMRLYIKDLAAELKEKKDVLYRIWELTGIEE